MLKYITSLALFTLLNITTYAQPREVTEAERSKFKQEIEKQAQQLRSRLEKGDKYLSFDQKISIDFAVDTFKIEALRSRIVDIDYSTAGMVNAGYELLGGYDKLLNKYYKILLSKLSPEDQETLKKAQRNWILYRDSESELIGTMSKEKYSGGGTIQSVITCSEVLSLTQERVFQLVRHLTVIME